MAEAVLYKAKSVADWSGAPGTLPLRAGDLVAVTSEAKRGTGWLVGFNASDPEHRALPFPQTAVQRVEVRAKADGAGETEASGRGGRARSPSSGSGSDEHEPGQAGGAGGAAAARGVDTSAHELSFDAYLEQFNAEVSPERGAAEDAAGAETRPDRRKDFLESGQSGGGSFSFSKEGEATAEEAAEDGGEASEPSAAAASIWAAQLRIRAAERNAPPSC